jgi:hypothetical protein
MGNNVEKKPKFFSNDGGDNYIIAKNVGVKMFKQLTYCTKYKPSE